MKEIVDRILKEEEVMRSRVESAQAQSKELVDRARAQAGASLNGITVELKRLSEKSRTEAEQGFRAEREAILAKTKNEAGQSREKRKRDIPQLAQKIFDQVVEIKR
jgi:vacuolar-type H+-ATPase subunit H